MTRQRPTPLVALCVPGLAALVEEELGGLPGVTVQERGFDGRSDVVLLQATDTQAREQVMRCRLVEDVLVEVAHTTRAQSQERTSTLASHLWPAQGYQRALSLWANTHRPLRAAETFRGIVRVRSEQAFLRTDLRRALHHAIQAERPRWRLADPASIEVWVLEYAPGHFLSGLRLSDATMRSHGGRQVERPGALRPTVAAAMVKSAGERKGGALLLDPCCGSGTILAQAQALGWATQGRDIDPQAVEIARLNAPRAHVSAGDVRHLDLPEASVAACVSNLPFGGQFARQGDPTRWLHDALHEMARVVHPGGSIVLLVPRIPSAVLPPHLHLRAQYRLSLLGTPTTLWVFNRG